MSAGTFKRVVVRVLLVPAALLLLGGSALAQSYRYMSCDDLWYARNSIYADEGYCFKTERGQEAFGYGCTPPYGRLTRAEQAEVSAIQTWERRKGCQ